MTDTVRVARRTPRGSPPARRTRERVGGGERSRSRAGILTALLLLCCLAAIGACAGGVFKVRTVDVEGVNLPQAQIVQASDVLGRNIFRIRTDTIVDRLAQVPSIEVVRVQTVFPDRVIIEARLRTAVIAWQARDGLHLVDATGAVMGTVPKTNLPVITGGPPAPDAAMVEALRYALTALPGAPNGAPAGFTIDPTLGFGITGRAGWKAVLGFGTAQTLVARVATLAALLRTIAGRPGRLTFADLRYREPYYRVSGS